MNKKGYTFAEVMITVAILGIVASIAPVFFNNVISFFTLASSKMEIQRDARAVLDIMNRNLRQASIESVTVDRLSSAELPYSRVTFTKVDETDSISYYQEGKNLMMDVGSMLPKKLCGNLRYLSFTFPRTDDLSIISVSLTVEKRAIRGAKKAIHVAIEKVRIMND